MAACVRGNGHEKAQIEETKSRELLGLIISGMERGWQGSEGRVGPASVMRRGKIRRAEKAMWRIAWKNEGKRGWIALHGRGTTVSGEQNWIRGVLGAGCGGSAV